jgi:DNA-directed RNA polymerase subunit K/omega
MSKEKRTIPLDKLLDYSGQKYEAAVYAIKAIRNLVKDGGYEMIDKEYNKVAGYALKKILEGEFEISEKE